MELLVTYDVTGADEFKRYDRKLIRISRNTAILMHLFHKEDDHDLESIWFGDICTDPELYMKESTDIYKEAAEQFIDQFEGHWCIAFCEALRNKCNELIEEHERDCRHIDESRSSEEGESPDKDMLSL